MPLIKPPKGLLAWLGGAKGPLLGGEKLLRPGANGSRDFGHQAPLNEAGIVDALTGTGITISGGTTAGDPVLLTPDLRDGSCFTFFMKDAESDIAGLYVLTHELLSGATADLPRYTSGPPSPVDLSSSTSPGSYATIVTWITDAGYPGITCIPDGQMHARMYVTVGGASAVFVRIVVSAYTALGGTVTLMTGDWQQVATGQNDFRCSSGLYVLNADDRIKIAFHAYNPAGDNDIYLTFGGDPGTDDNRARLDFPADISLLPDWAVADYWTRTGTELTPATAGDNISATGTTGTGMVQGVNTGGGNGVSGTSVSGNGVYGVSDSAAAVKGISDSGSGGIFSSTDGDGVRGYTASAANNDYSVRATGLPPRTLLGEYADLEEAVAPATPETGVVRIYAKTDGKVYSKDDVGTEYDLTATGAGGYAEVQEEGAAVTARTKLNFIGSALTAADDAGNTRTNVTVTAILNTLASLANAGGYLKNDGAGALSWFADLWTKTSTYLSPTTADDDLLLHDGTVIAWGDGNPGSPDTIMSRIAANKAGMTSGDAFRAGDFCELAEVATPTTPASGFGLHFVNTSGRPCFVDDTGAVHVLSLVNTQTFYGSAYSDSATGGNLNFVATASPGAIVPSGGITSTVHCAFLDDDWTALPQDTQGNAILLNETYQKVKWTSAYGVPPLTYQQYAVAIGVPVRRFAADYGTTACKLARVTCRMRSDNVSRFHSFKLTLHDLDGSHVSTTDITSTIALDNTWYVASSALIDISAYTNDLRITLTCSGQTSVSGDVGLQQVDVEYLAIELWTR